jgi:hypothetical protein
VEWTSKLLYFDMGGNELDFLPLAGEAPTWRVISGLEMTLHGSTKYGTCFFRILRTQIIHCVKSRMNFTLLLKSFNASAPYITFKHL